MSGSGKRFEVRPMGPEDLEQVLELVKSALGPGSVPRTPEFWRWKHHESPFGVSPAWVAVAGEQVVGLRTFLRWRWRFDERTIKAVRAVDTATHPDWQRRGIFWQLTREALDVLAEGGCEFVFNTPNRRSGAGYRKMGWNRALKPTLWALAFKPLRMAGAAIRPGAGRRAADLADFGRAEELLDWPGLEEVLAEYHRGWKGKLFTPRNRDYLDWRYVQVPELEYHTLWARRSDAALALVIRSRLRRGMREVRIAEILGHGAADARAELLRELLDRVRTRSGCDYLVAASPPGSPEADDLRAAGFRRIPSGPSLMVRPLPGSSLGGAELTGDSWQLSIGDLEVF